MTAGKPWTGFGGNRSSKLSKKKKKNPKLMGGRSDHTQPSLDLNFKVSRSFPGREERAKCSARHPGSKPEVGYMPGMMLYTQLASKMFIESACPCE